MPARDDIVFVAVTCPRSLKITGIPGNSPGSFDGDGGGIYPDLTTQTSSGSHGSGPCEGTRQPPDANRGCEQWQGRHHDACFPCVSRHVVSHLLPEKPAFFFRNPSLSVDHALLFLFSFSSSLCVCGVHQHANGTNNGNFFSMGCSSIFITLVVYTVELDSVSAENV